MKKVILVLWVLALFSITACSSLDSPSSVVEEFYSLVEAGELNEAYELINQDGKKMMQVLGGANLLSDLTEKIKNNEGIESIKFVNEEITGDMAKVNFQINYGNGKTKSDKEKLIKENGSWRLTISK